MSKVETFYLKSSAVTKQYVVIGFITLFGLFFVILAISLEDIITGLIGLVFLIGAGFVYRKNFGTKSYVALSDDGVNVNGKVVILWDDIENVTEEEYKEDYKYVSANKKRICIRYANRQKGKIDQALITEDFEGYSYLKEKIISKVAIAQG